MCKFHKDVARDLATDPSTNQFNAGIYSVALVAMAKFRIEQYMPSMFGCDGFVPSLLIEDAAKEAFKESGLAKPEAEIKSYRDSHIEAIRTALTQTATRHDLTLEGLGIPDKITKDGYKHCDKMAADITQSGPFLEEAMVQFYEGYEDAGKSYVKGELTLADAPHQPTFAALHAAVADFMTQPHVVPVLKQMFENSLAHVFQTAEADFNAGRGLEKTGGCVMCKDHGDGTSTVPVAEIKIVPKTLKNKLFYGCASCATASSGTALGILASHIPCVAIPVIGSFTGVAVGGKFMTASMLAISPTVAATATLGLDKLRGQKPSKIKAVIAAGLALQIASGMSLLTHRSCTMCNIPAMGSNTEQLCGMPSIQHSFQRATSQRDGDRADAQKQVQSQTK